MKRIVFLAGASALMLAGCATAPEAIAPAYVSEMTYENWTCDQMVEEMGRLNAAYTQVADQQHQARRNDTVGVLLIGLPVSSLSGSNVAAQVASVKGNQVALERAATRKNCSTVHAEQKR